MITLIFFFVFNSKNQIPYKSFWVFLFCWGPDSWVQCPEISLGFLSRRPWLWPHPVQPALPRQTKISQMLGICVENVSLGSNPGPATYLLVTRSNFLNPSEPQIPHLQNRGNTFQGGCQGSMGTYEKHRVLNRCSSALPFSISVSIETLRVLSLVMLSLNPPACALWFFLLCLALPAFSRFSHRGHALLWMRCPPPLLLP